jgi:hypothetical protein
LAVADPILAAYFQTRMLLFALRCGSAFGLSYALSLEACFTSTRGVGTRARTEELVALADVLADKSKTPRSKTITRVARAFAASLQERPIQAIALFDQAIELARDYAPDYDAIRQTQLHALWAHAQVGDIRELSSQLESLLREASDRNDLATGTTVRVGPFFWRAWLRNGDSASVRAATEEAMRRWTSRVYHTHHLFACWTLTEVDLYECKGAAAFERIVREFPRAARALMFQIERAHWISRAIRGRAAVLAAAQTAGRERARFLSCARSDADWLRRQRSSHAGPWGWVVLAGIGALQDDRSGAKAALEAAIVGFEATHDRFAAACARARLGALLGQGDARARALLEEADGYMREQEIRDPLRMAAAVVPGVEP